MTETKIVNVIDLLHVISMQKEICKLNHMTVATTFPTKPLRVYSEEALDIHYPYRDIWYNMTCWSILHARTYDCTHFPSHVGQFIRLQAPWLTMNPSYHSLICFLSKDVESKRKFISSLFNFFRFDCLAPIVIVLYFFHGDPLGFFIGR